ncbi:hypothetical protein CTRI78_v001877 [Colletotrichum trifolii]|uniref:Ricin B lectin domain-containing protein n=1 Tax=Colletotrichum trifolii TaxID=5466 RepID=A0A4R8RSP7_COLTR|nr:hypothetical protein CTRI78_v001877 [Colletotrichum trifolii]
MEAIMTEKLAPLDEKLTQLNGKLTHLILETPCSSPVFTPCTCTDDMTDANGMRDGQNNPGDVPWPGTTFRIVEKATGRAMTLIDGELAIRDATGPDDPNTHWFCVEKNGCFGLMNPDTGRYLGNDGGTHVRAWSHEMGEWEYLTMRKHPSGGYQILSPAEENKLKVMCVAQNRTVLCRRDHGTTLWVFNKVEEAGR